jgi:hypothetical protein
VNRLTRSSCGDLLSYHDSCHLSERRNVGQDRGVHHTQPFDASHAPACNAHYGIFPQTLRRIAVGKLTFSRPVRSIHWIDHFTGPHFPSRSAHFSLGFDIAPARPPDNPPYHSFIGLKRFFRNGSHARYQVYAK